MRQTAVMKRKKRRRPTGEASCVCDACGEEIVVPVDLFAGKSQEYVEEWKWRGVPVWSHDGLIRLSAYLRVAIRIACLLPSCFGGHQPVELGENNETEDCCHGCKTLETAHDRCFLMMLSYFCHDQNTATTDDPAAAAKRHLIAELAEALAAKGKGLLVYYNHSCNQGQDRPWEQAVGYHGRNKEIFAQNLLDIVCWMGERYKEKMWASTRMA